MLQDHNWEQYEVIWHGLFGAVWAKRIKRGLWLAYQPLTRRCGNPKLQRIYNVQYLATFTRKADLVKEARYLAMIPVK
jgi:hypothetical protein